jgi:hypothetical protein
MVRESCLFLPCCRVKLGKPFSIHPFGYFLAAVGDVGSSWIERTQFVMVESRIYLLPQYWAPDSNESSSPSHTHRHHIASYLIALEQPTDPVTTKAWKPGEWSEKSGADVLVNCVLAPT